jgi:hypothetical protein
MIRQRVEEKRGFRTISLCMKVYRSILEFSDDIVTYIKGILRFFKVITMYLEGILMHVKV